jgi:transposase
VSPTRAPNAIEVVHRLADQIGFQVPPRRWVVERFLAWINRDRRLAKDFEAGIASAEAFPRRCHCHAAQSTLGALNLSFESDSQSMSP